MFRMCGRDDQQGVVAGDYIVKVLKAKKVAVIHDKDTYGQGLADATRAQLNKLGVKEVLYEGPDPRREGLQRAGYQDPRLRCRGRLLRRPASGSRSAGTADA